MLFVLVVLLAGVASPVSTSALPLGEHDVCAGSTSGTCGMGEGDPDPGGCHAGGVCATDAEPTYGFRAVVALKAHNESEDPELIAQEAELVMKIHSLKKIDRRACRKIIKRIVRERVRDNGCFDQYSRLTPPKDTAALVSGVTASGVGVGVTLSNFGKKPEIVVVVMALDANGPAYEAGIRRGDIIIRVEDAEGGRCRKQGLADRVSQCLSGPLGSLISITVKRNGEEKEFFNIARRETFTPTVIHGETTSGLVYLLVTQFGSETGPEFVDALRLRCQGKIHCKVVLDLRGNGGGFFHAASSALASLVPDNGDVLYTQHSRHGTKSFTVEDVVRVAKIENPGWDLKVGEFRDVQFGIIVDKGCASACELFAGAVANRKHTDSPSFVVGKKTFGKAIGQALFELPSGWILTLTRSEYRIGDNEIVVHRRGIKPDYTVKDTRKAWSDTATPRDAQYVKAVTLLQNRL